MDVHQRSPCSDFDSDFNLDRNMGMTGAPYLIILPFPWMKIMWKTIFPPIDTRFSVFRLHQYFSIFCAISSIHFSFTILIKKATGSWYHNVNQIIVSHYQISFICLPIAGLSWVYYCIAISCKHYPQKGRFYCYFGIFFTVWFAMEPFMIILTNKAVASHERYERNLIFNHIKCTS